MFRCIFKSLSWDIAGSLLRFVLGSDHRFCDYMPEETGDLAVLDESWPELCATHDARYLESQHHKLPS